MPHRIQIAGLDSPALREQGGIANASRETRRPDATGAIIRLSTEARRLLANSGGGGGGGDMASVPAQTEEDALSAPEPAAIDVEFEPIRRARERVAPAQIVPAESLQAETVTPVVWLRVANLDDPPPARSIRQPAPEIPRRDGTTATEATAVSWLKPSLSHDGADYPAAFAPAALAPAALAPADLAAAVLVSLDSARRASYGGFDHAHRAGDCAFCRRAVAAYR